jgi:hypothetical protein
LMVLFWWLLAGRKLDRWRRARSSWSTRSVRSILLSCSPVVSSSEVCAICCVGLLVSAIDGTDSRNSPVDSLRSGAVLPYLCNTVIVR